MFEMKVTLDREGTNIVKLGVEVEPDHAMKAYEIACKQLCQRINIPGFRRGKAPRNIVEKMVGVDFIKKETLERLVPEVLGQAITQEKLDVITEPQIDQPSFNLGEPLKLSATFEVRPEVKLGEYKGIATSAPAAIMPEEAEGTALQSIAEAKADLTTVDPRPIREGDTVLLDFECCVGGELVEGGKAEGLLLEIKEGNFLPGFCEALVGKEPGQHTEIKATFPAEYRNVELAGKEADFKVDLKEVRERQVPPIDDDLAKSVGQQSLVELKKALHQRMEEELRQENEARAQKAVVEEIVKNAEVDIPESMIDREANLLLHHHKRFIEQQKQKWDEYIKTHEYQEKYAEIREESTNRVRTSLVLGAIVRAESMMVTGEEWRPYLMEMVARYNVPIEQLAHNEELRRFFEELKRQSMEEALTRKVIDFLLSHADVKCVPEEEFEAAESEARKKEKGTSAGRSNSEKKKQVADKEEADSAQKAPETAGA
jgi:trigger factor